MKYTCILLCPVQDCKIVDLVEYDFKPRECGFVLQFFFFSSQISSAITFILITETCFVK